MADIKRSLYNVALGGQGFLLYGTPLKPSRTLIQAPVFGNRFASGDRDYADLTFWWYWAQTDWSFGLKDKVSWEDDGKFYYSTNIDTVSEIGAMKLHKKQELDNTFGETVSCGVAGEIGGVMTKVIGTIKTGGVIKIYGQTTGAWGDITPGAGLSGDRIASLEIKNDLLWVTMVFENSAFTDTAGSQMLYSYNGTTWTDRTAAMITGLDGGFSLWGIFWTLTIGADTYVGCNSDSVGGAKTSFLAKFDGTTWTKIFGRTSAWMMIDGQEYNGKIYYLLNNRTVNNTYGFELRVYDPVADTDVSVYVWSHLSGINYGLRTGKLLLNFMGKLIISIGWNPGEVWSFNGTIMQRLWHTDEKKADLSFEFATAAIALGGVIKSNRIYWRNLIFDGEYFSQWIRAIADADAHVYYPLFTYQNTIYGKDDVLGTKLYKESTSYKGTATKNFLVFNQMDVISTIDKLFYSCNLIFQKLASGQKILIEYSTDEMVTWTSLGNVDYAVDGATITSKTLYFAENIIESKLWLRAKLEGGGSNTPILYDVSMAYYPLPYYKQRWNLTLNCIDKLVLLDGKTEEQKQGEELRNLLKTFWKNRNALEYQDVDYAATAINDGSGLTAVATTITVDSTASFAEQGIIRIENEKINLQGEQQ